MNIKVDRDLLSPFLEKIKDGKILIPKFQRDFVWSPKQIIDLFDSIMRGFPIGSLILWCPEKARFNTYDTIEGVKINADYDTIKDPCYVLDGRQRITALLSTLYTDGFLSKSLYINLDEMKLFFRPLNSVKRKENCISLFETFDTYLLVEYLQRLHSSNISEEKKKEYTEKAKSVTKILTCFDIGYIKVMGGTIDDAVEIFSRLNSRGLPISPDFMIQALAYNSETDFLFGDKITGIKAGLDDYNFSDIKRDLVLKCVYNHTDVVFFDGTIQTILGLKSSLPSVMEDVKNEMYKAVEFLYRDCGIVNSHLLPYSYQLIMLAYFFKCNLDSDNAKLRELRKWFFYTTYYSYFTNTSFPIIRADFDKFKKFAENKVAYPIDYCYNGLDLNLPKRISLGGVRSCALVSFLVQKRGLNKKKDVNLQICLLVDSGDRTAGNVFVCADKEEFALFKNYVFSDAVWDEKYSAYMMNKDLLDLIRTGHNEMFIELRQSLLLQEEMKFLKDIFEVEVISDNFDS